MTHFLLRAARNWYLRYRFRQRLRAYHRAKRALAQLTIPGDNDR